MEVEAPEVEEPGDLWPGAVSDSEYNKREGYLQRQKDFAENNLVILEENGTPTSLPFTNILIRATASK